MLSTPGVSEAGWNCLYICSPEFNSSPTYINSWLIYFLPAKVSNPFMVIWVAYLKTSQGTCTYMHIHHKFSICLLYNSHNSRTLPLPSLSFLKMLHLIQGIKNQSTSIIKDRRVQDLNYFLFTDSTNLCTCWVVIEITVIPLWGHHWRSLASRK